MERRMKSPRESLTAASVTWPVLKEISGAVGKRTSLYNLRLCSSDDPVNSPNFFEIMLEPDLGHPDESFQAYVVMRNADFDILISEFKSMPEKLTAIVETVEQSSGS